MRAYPNGEGVIVNSERSPIAHFLMQFAGKLMGTDSFTPITKHKTNQVGSIIVL